MAPSAESTSTAEDDCPIIEGYPCMVAPSKNVAFAVNYELAMVDQFLSVDKRKRGLRSIVETPTSSTLLFEEPPLVTFSNAISMVVSSSGLRRASNLENDTPNRLRQGSPHSNDDAVQQEQQELPPQQQQQQQQLPQQQQPPEEPKDEKATDAVQVAAMLSPPPPNFSGRRVSTRDKQKREAPLARTRVRYDMQLVPPVRRNRAFLCSFEAWWVATDVCSKKKDAFAPPKQNNKRRSSRLANNTSTDDPSEEVRHCECDDDSTVFVFPFAEDTSVVWIPAKRSEWEDTVSEMTAVCTSAAIRRLRQDDSDQQQRPFQPPLSRDYIRDRIDIDDPLKGYQIRHKEGGWLQGFILFTHFTTWTYGFHWDSKHPLCGLLSSLKGASTETDNRYVDVDGSLAAELEALPRSGDPGAGGIVFPNIAEIALLGGLGCGEYLLRMALDDIRAQEQYKFVALQATDQSRTFYERFGFVRVGAICQYGKPELQQQTSEAQQQEEEPSVMGYRHWTHANESERSLQMHGGPSYMMCLKLPERDAEMEPTIRRDCAQCGSPLRTKASFVDQMLMALRVESKPRVEQLGASTTPCPKFAARRSNSLPIEVSASFDCIGNSSPRGGNSKKKIAKNGSDTKPARRKSNAAASPFPPSCANTTIATPIYVAKSASTSTTRGSNLSSAATSRSVKVAKMPKRSLSSNDFPEVDEPSYKRHKVEAKRAPKQVPTNLAACPPKGRPFSFVEKQYHSVWLAVPPAQGATTPRPPPKSRVAFSGDVSKSSSAKKWAVALASRTRPAASTSSSSLLASPRPTDASVAAAPRKPTTTQPGSAKSVAKSPFSKRKKVRSDSLLDTVSKAESGRIYHSVRGPDGKFVRVYIDDPDQQLQPQPAAGKTHQSAARPTSIAKMRASPSSAEKKSLVAPEKRAYADRDDSENGSPDRPSLIATMKPGAPAPIDKATLRKQKVKSYPRNRVHYYNRVVKPKRGNHPSKDNKYFFVIEFDETKDLLCLVPMLVGGTLLGKRVGRPRYQCAIGDTDENFKIVAAADYVVVRSAMVMKTPILASEAWDIENTDDVDFVTR